MIPTPHRSWRDQILPALVFLILGIAALAVFVLVVEPRDRKPRGAAVTGYSEAPLEFILGQDGLAERMKEIGMAGEPGPGERTIGRYSGTPGFYRTEALIRDVFVKAGLEILTQEFPVVVPVTEVCELRDEDGQVLTDIQLYPVEPSGLLPVSLPPEGIKGEIVPMDAAGLRGLAGRRAEDVIALTGVDGAMAGWPVLAGVGVKALLMREDEMSRSLRPDADQRAPWTDIQSMNEVEFPRILVRGPIDKYAGRRVTLRAQVTWQTRYVRNYIGVLRGRETASEALVLNAYYDSSSMVPDVAPGAEQAIPLAALLECVRGLAPYRDQLPRDILFIVTAGHAQTMAGCTRLLESIEPFTERQAGGRTLEKHRMQHQRALEKLAAPVPPPEIMAQVAGEVNLDRREDSIEVRLAYLRAGSPVYREGFNPVLASDAERKKESNSHPLLLDYLAAKRRENQSANLMTTPQVVRAAHPMYAEWRYEERLRAEVEKRKTFHAQQVKELNQTIAVRALFRRYEKTFMLNLELNSGGAMRKDRLAVLVGMSKVGPRVEPQVSELANLLHQKAGPAPLEVISWGAADADGRREVPNRHSRNATDLESESWFSCGRLAFSVVNYEFLPPKLGTPEDTLDGMNLDVARRHLGIVARSVLAIAYRQIPFKNITADTGGSVLAFRGKVLGMAGSGGLLASHPMADRTFVRIGTDGSARSESDLYTRGVRTAPILMTDPDGSYELPMAFGRAYSSLTADAARFGKDGRLRYFKDASPAAQMVHRSDRIPSAELVLSGGEEVKPINIEVFPAKPVSFYGRNNPQTQQNFKGVTFLSKAGLTGPARSANSGYTIFLEPDFEFYVGLMDGALGNDQILEYRAFLMNVDPDAPILPEEPELWGRGYRVADTPVVTWPHFDAAATMIRTAEKRLRLQQQFGMADKQMLSLQQNAKDFLTEARQQRAAGDLQAAANTAGAALAFVINNQPVIRQRISQAVVGILWYLGLLVPFVFFVEKLVVGSPDIRKQLLSVGLLFVVVFLLLRYLHPAFQMVRAPLVILLGFVILLLTLLVTLMVGGKFRQNLKDLRRAEGQVDGADISRGGVVGTAFMLGLNNMRRRKVRTGLTCITLVLITFVMICFTSVSTDLVSEEYAVGRSPWNGLLIRNESYLPVDYGSIANIEGTFGATYPVARHTWVQTALLGSQPNFQNADILIDRSYSAGETKVQKRSRVSAAMVLPWNEPDYSGMDKFLLTSRGWFTPPPLSRAEVRAAVANGTRFKREAILPDTVAAELGLTKDAVNEGGAVVNIRGDDYEVIGIIDTAQLDKLTGPDGQSPLPYDINSVQSFGQVGSGRWIVSKNVKPLPASQVILLNTEPKLKDGEEAIIASVNILFPRNPYKAHSDDPERPGMDYKAQRRAVVAYLERSGRHANYAIDGVAYYGVRQRAKTLTGLLELLVPILLAALTVFNTMRSSVYERKSEIYVYNAVGIAPNHVFFIFMAEALVYAVVGAMCGYLLSQASGRALTVLGLTGGLNMDYSSIETIYASLAIVAAVLLSTILPARDAARLAAPAETRSWSLPHAEADTMEFSLPFTFTEHDRVAVVSYFWHWLDSHGSGSSETFYCSPPEVEVLRGQELVPAVASTVWLKPYDLGVSQRMEISLPTDPETGEYIARVKLVRLSGRVSSWQRTLKPFLVTVRKQFLNWRVTTDADRRVMFAEAKSRLQQVMS